ncbi:MAG: hypothetical protein GY875_12310 [Gammaproteobacteria bacterium]|nr:hypothetical protein [Gammaproteobacteria bacterium]
MVTLIAILILVFLSYVRDTEKALERSSIQQTKRVIDSSLVVVFSNYAVTGRMDRLHELDGANPFVFLEEFEIRFADYRGELGHDLRPRTEPGWYYLKHRKLVGYKAHFIEKDIYFQVRLFYEDRNQSGNFDYGIDQFEHLSFIPVLELTN